MLEHSAMYFNIPPPLLEEESTPFPDFYTRLGQCELQDPVWAKMSALAAGVKKRKKSETKPQAQINKCNNEKRRREQENIYIEELAELISANFADMSSLSVKPDKCAILQETVNQIRSIKQRESSSQSSDPVQQGEVSSSRPTILSTDVYGPLLLEALEGFLFVVNAEGKVEHVTKNVSNFIKYTEEEVLGKSIYNFIHHGDHARFSSSLLPIPIGWASEPTNKSRSFSCRLLIKPDDPEDSGDEKQPRETRYELMCISSTQLTQGTVSDDDNSDSGPCLMCVASRITHRDRASIFQIEQFTTKLDITGKIIGVDTSGVTAYSQFLNKELMDRLLQDLCIQQDTHKLTQHLRDTISSGQATSVTYRLRLSHDRYLNVQTKSKLFKANPHCAEMDFIMATHSIIGENDSTKPNDPGGGSSGGGSGGGTNLTNNTIGGPLMTSVVNGTRNGPLMSTNNENHPISSLNNTLNSTSNPIFTAPPFLIENDIGVDISSTWGDISWLENHQDSRQSVTPVSTPTPRPPSAPTYSPGTAAGQSPFVPQASPTVPNPSTPFAMNTFTFSPMDDPSFPMEEQKDTKANILEEPSTMMADSARLRNLLTKPPNSVDSADSDSKNKHKILKGLLNQPDDDENMNENRSSPRTSSLSVRNSLAGPSDTKSNTSGGNNMLLQLLNEKSDDDDREVRAGMKPSSELLQQLLKDDEQKTEMQSQDDTLLRSLGFTNSPSPTNGETRGRKRPSDEREDNSKRSSDGVSSSKSDGKLWRKNRMLASLLAKQPNPQPIPPVPNSVITATPQEGLPKIIPEASIKNNANKMMGPNANMQQQQQQQQQQVTTQQQQHQPQSNQNIITTTRNTRLARPTITYLNQMLTTGENILQRIPQNRQFGGQQPMDSAAFPASSDGVGIAAGMWEIPTNSDLTLSDILDQVIDIVPEAEMNNSDILTSVLDAIDNTPNNSYLQREGISEKMAINIIQKSLMQFESAVNSPTSPNITLANTPPAYSTVAVTNPTNQTGGFPPPPNYQRANFQRSVSRTGNQQYTVPLPNQQKKISQNERDRVRLLRQQEQQKIVFSPNTTVELNSDMQSIDSLLNNSVAPNVSLQRSSSVPESQLSPTYVGQVTQSTQRLNKQQPYSPHSQLTSPLGQQAGFTQTTVGNYQHSGSRLSPHPPFNQQLSPRQAYLQGATQNATWQTQQAQGKLSVQQQQNPMLNAQLTSNYVSVPGGRNFAVQRAPQQQQRAIGSPGVAPTRHSPFPTDNFPPPGSPNASFNQNQYLRLQRANSAPNATTQLPGGLGSPRPYGRDPPTHASYNPIPQTHHSMMYQQDSQYCYDQTGLQLPYNGADRGRVPPHLQAGVGGSTTSEYVRQELRNVVGARAGQAQPPNNRAQSQLLNQAVTPADLDLSHNFDLPTSASVSLLGVRTMTSLLRAGASESPKLWGAIGSDMGSMSPQPATSRTTMEEVRQGDHSSQSSLLQKLLSDDRV